MPPYKIKLMIRTVLQRIVNEFSMLGNVEVYGNNIFIRQEKTREDTWRWDQNLAYTNYHKVGISSCIFIFVKSKMVIFSYKEVKVIRKYIAITPPYFFFFIFDPVFSFFLLPLLLHKRGSRSERARGRGRGKVRVIK